MEKKAPERLLVEILIDQPPVIGTIDGKEAIDLGTRCLMAIRLKTDKGEIRRFLASDTWLQHYSSTDLVGWRVKIAGGGEMIVLNGNKRIKKEELMPNPIKFSAHIRTLVSGQNGANDSLADFKPLKGILRYINEPDENNRYRITVAFWKRATILSAFRGKNLTKIKRLIREGKENGKTASRSFCVDGGDLPAMTLEKYIGQEVKIQPKEILVNFQA
ncbi:MAG: hypothetical protein PHO56_04045 [Patescibacteria group bacterium]|nr:hypothetical protein [Patescibacteria group bacterium]